MRIFSIVITALLLSLPQLALAQETTAFSRLTNLQQKKEVQLQLDQPKVDKIKQGCSAAQQSLKAISTKIDSALKKRQLLYGDIQKESKAMEIRLTRQGVDASELDLLIGKNQQVIDDMVLANSSYQAIADDLTVINCQENPELFYFGLSLLREDLLNLDKNDIKIYDLVKNANKTTFIPLANRLIL